MALSGKLEAEIEIKASADEFYKMFRSQSHHLPNICSDKISKIEVHEGDWETLGSVKHWTYNLEGSTMRVKETIESANDENRSLTFNILEGDLMKLYKSVNSSVQVTPKLDEGSLVKWTIVYEKLSQDAPEMDAYIDIATSVTRDIDAHLVKA